MLHLLRHYASSEDRPKPDNAIAKAAFQIGASVKPKVPWVAEYAYIGGMKWKPFVDSDLNWRYLEWGGMSNSILMCIAFVLRKDDLKDMRQVMDVGIYDVTAKRLYVDANTKRIVVVRKSGYVWQPVGYLNGNDSLHRVQVTFEPGCELLKSLIA